MIIVFFPPSAPPRTSPPLSVQLYILLFSFKKKKIDHKNENQNKRKTNNTHTKMPKENKVREKVHI